MKGKPFFYFIIFFLLSCEGDYDITYEWTGLDVHHAENTGDKPQPTTLDSIPARAYVLRLDLFPVELSRKGRYLDQETPPNNVNPMVDINVTSSGYFNPSHPAGTSLNDVFLIFNNNYLYTSTLDNHNITNAYSEDFDDQPLPHHADLLLMVPPDSLGEGHVFKVYIKLKDGTVFTDSTTLVKLY